MKKRRKTNKKNDKTTWCFGAATVQPRQGNPDTIRNKLIAIYQPYLTRRLTVSDEINKLLTTIVDSHMSELAEREEHNPSETTSPLINSAPALYVSGINVGAGGNRRPELDQELRLWIDQHRFSPISRHIGLADVHVSQTIHEHSTRTTGGNRISELYSRRANAGFTVEHSTAQLALDQISLLHGPAVVRLPSSDDCNCRVGQRGRNLSLEICGACFRASHTRLHLESTRLQGCLSSRENSRAERAASEAAPSTSQTSASEPSTTVFPSSTSRRKPLPWLPHDNLTRQMAAIQDAATSAAVAMDYLADTVLEEYVLHLHGAVLTYNRGTREPKPEGASRAADREMEAFQQEALAHFQRRIAAARQRSIATETDQTEAYSPPAKRHRMH